MKDSSCLDCLLVTAVRDGWGRGCVVRPLGGCGQGVWVGVDAGSCLVDMLNCQCTGRFAMNYKAVTGACC